MGKWGLIDRLYSEIGEPIRGAPKARPQRRPAKRKPERCRAREREERPAGACRRKGKWPRRLHRRRTLGANCPAALGTAFEVTAFDGWSVRSPAKTALETWPGRESTNRAATSGGMRPHSERSSRRWKTVEGTFPDVGKRDSGQAAKRRIKQAVRSSRPDGLRSSLGWLLPPSAACLSVSEARQSAASSSSRAPPKTKTRRRAERTGRRQPPSSRERRPGQPASARRSGGPTADRAHADGGSAGTRPACRASIGAAQRRPCSEPRPAARSRSTARRRAVRGGEERQRRAGGTSRAARQRREVSRYQLPRHGRPIAGSTFVRRPGRTTIFLFAAFLPKSSKVRKTRRADAARHSRDW